MEISLYVFTLGVVAALFAGVIRKRTDGIGKHFVIRMSITSALMCTLLVDSGRNNSRTIAAPRHEPTAAAKLSSTAQSPTPVKKNGLIALVIGNNSYKYPQASLNNPVNDATDMKDILTGFGFTVDFLLDADYTRMGKAIDDFIAKLGPQTVGLFYYAGHGMQIDGENYLIPIDFVMKDEAVAKKTSYSASLLNERMEDAQTGLSIIVLDACRNNPFRSERLLVQGGGGLAAMDAGKGTFIAFATSPNKTAIELKKDRNGLFTKYLLQALKETPSCLNEVFDRTRAAVYEASKHRQLPWVATSAIGSFCFSESSQPQEACKGKSPGNVESFSVDKNYAPSGIFGDIDDVRIMPTPASCVFEYTTTGQGSHEWEYKDKPAGFGGVFYLDPPNNFGTVCGGFDLRRFRRLIRWEARSLGGEVTAEFIIGGVDWIWDEGSKKRIKPEFPDSMPRVSLGIRKLSTNWQTFEADLSDRPESDFTRVVNGFTWMISWSANGVRFNKDHTGAEQPKTFKIEIRNIRYER